MRRSRTARVGQRLSVAVASVVLAVLLAGAVSTSGCAISESIDEAFLSGRVMRFNDLDPDRNIAGEVGGTFRGFEDGGGGCPT